MQKVNPKKSKFKNSWYIKGYQLAKEGHSDTAIAKLLGVGYVTFRNHKRKNRDFRIAIKKGRKELVQTKHGQGKASTFINYFYGRLPDHLKALWNDIKKSEEDPTLIGKVEALLENGGQKTRQHLFLYALVHYNFNLTKACASVNIARKTFHNWVTEDPDFEELINEIHQAKKDFFEAALIDLVEQRDKNAVLFVNKTVNADRGYNPTVTIKKDVNVTKTIKTQAVPVEELNLTLEEKKKILSQMRRIQKEENE